MTIFEIETNSLSVTDQGWYFIFQNMLCTFTIRTHFHIVSDLCGVMEKAAVSAGIVFISCFTDILY